MTAIVAIDPGKHSSGVACFVNGELAWTAHANRPPIDVLVDRVIFEHMQVDDRTRGKVQDVIDCQLGGAVLAGRFAPKGEILSVKPLVWKGSVPKRIHQARILARLSDAERERAELDKLTARKRSDVIDAIGIGLWYLRRMDK